uniref:Uncharacterized protein n=1 Tax=Arundo donax TaxID=35708 RepID=A0A0A8Y3X9_ARUDO
MSTSATRRCEPCCAACMLRCPPASARWCSGIISLR